MPLPTTTGDDPMQRYAMLKQLTYQYYVETATRLGGNRACLAVTRKLLKRSYHTLRELGEEALQPA